MIATSDGPIRRRLIAGVDVGGTKTSVVVTDDDDQVLYEHVAPTNRSAVVGQIAGLVDDAQRELQREVAAVGVAIPGHVDPQDGSVSMAVNLGITHLALGPMLQTELGIPTFVEHDARAAALWLSKQPHMASAMAMHRAWPSWPLEPASRLASYLTARCSAVPMASPAKLVTSWRIRMDPSARVACAAVSRPSLPGRPSAGRPMRPSPLAATPCCHKIPAPPMYFEPAQPATR